MSKLIATNSFVSKDWSFELQDLADSYVDLHIKFVGNRPAVSFMGLSFSFELKANDETIVSEIFPKDGVRYVKTSDQPVEKARLPVLAGALHTLRVSATNNGETYTGEYQFTPPVPEKPFASWVWENHKWNPPVPRPEAEGGGYDNYWNEEAGEWRPLSELEGA